jgi:two-component system sensor histidine kinase KdpD
VSVSGKLRVYLGAAPGVGKTYAMLDEGHRRSSRGTDVVVAFVETHGRAHTAALLDGLEAIPRRTITYRGGAFTEMDTDAVLARTPKVALVDELAHTNVPGAQRDKRWQDVEAMLDVGIDVITTVNIQHLESLNDVITQITGVVQHETVPDEIVRAAEQVELVDMTAEALRRRMAHGNIYGPDKIDAALANYFRVGNLTALRELALLWLADKVDDQLDRYREQHHIGGTWEARERVVVALTGGPEGDTLIRRASRVADRSKGADLLAVHVARSDGLVGADPAHLARQRLLVERLGGTYHQVVGDSIPTALLDFARAVNATQLVLGTSRRGRFAHAFSRGVGVSTTAQSGPIDVHLVTHEEAGQRLRTRSGRTGLAIRRRLTGYALTAAGLPALTVTLAALRGDLSLATDIMFFLAAVVAVALVGGLYPALVAAIAGSLLLNFFFTPPIHKWTIAAPENVLALSVFVIVGAAVSAAVESAARRSRQAAQARAEAETLSTIAGGVLRGERPLSALLEQMREAFNLSGVSLLERRLDALPSPDQQRDPSAWQIAASVGAQPCATPADGDVDVSIDDTLTLALRGHPLPAADRRVVEAFAAQAAIALRQERLAQRASEASTLAEVDRLRTALLSAVSHDLRSPLASAKAAVNGLRSRDVIFDETDRDDLLATVEESLDDLTRLVDNLLDMSRLQAGALGMQVQPLSVAETVAQAVRRLGSAGRGITINVPDDLPEMTADAALLERILVNVLSNALQYSPAATSPAITGSAHAGHVEIRIIDTGPGIPVSDRDRVFLPFQRLGDRAAHTGVGLGLALSRGLAEAMGGELEPDDTPGGGLTMTLRLPAISLGNSTADGDPISALP